MFRSTPDVLLVQERIREVTRDSNLHAASVMERIRDFVNDPEAVTDGAAARKLAVRLALEVNERSFELGGELAQLRARLRAEPERAAA